MRPDQWQAFIAQFAQLSPRQRIAGADLLRHGDPLLAQLPGLALDTRRAPHHVARELGQSHSRFFSTHDSDIAFFYGKLSV